MPLMVMQPGESPGANVALSTVAFPTNVPVPLTVPPVMFAPPLAYLTSDEPIRDPLLATFEILDVVPFDIKKLKKTLRSRAVGRLEIKHRGLRLDPDRLRQQLQLAGDEAASLLIAGSETRTWAILASRCEG